MPHARLNKIFNALFGAKTAAVKYATARFIFVWLTRIFDEIGLDVDAVRWKPGLNEDVPTELA